jgi:dihydrofolate reductase
MKTYVYVAQSLDGYIAGPNGELDWLNQVPNPDNDDFGYAEFMDRIDAVVMGRHTYQTVLSFGDWPYTKPVFVASSTLESLPSDGAHNVEIVNLHPIEILKKLEKEGLTSLYVDGGLLIQSFLTAGLIDELIITTIPILLGEGIPLFGKLGSPVAFNLVKSEVMVGSLVKNHYTKQHFHFD